MIWLVKLQISYNCKLSQAATITQLIQEMMSDTLSPFTQLKKWTPRTLFFRRCDELAWGMIRYDQTGYNETPCDYQAYTPAYPMVFLAMPESNSVLARFFNL